MQRNVPDYAVAIKHKLYRSKVHPRATQSKKNRSPHPQVHKRLNYCKTCPVSCT